MTEKTNDFIEGPVELTIEEKDQILYGSTRVSNQYEVLDYLTKEKERLEKIFSIYSEKLSLQKKFDQSEEILKKKEESVLIKREKIHEKIREKKFYLHKNLAPFFDGVLRQKN